MIGSKREIARMQSDFYRDQYRKMLRWLIICLALCILLTGVIIYLVLFQPTQTFYANTVEGRILPMPPAIVQRQG